MVGKNLKESQLQQIVDKTMRSVDADEDGKINFEEFCAIVYKRKVVEKVEKMTEPIAQTIWTVIVKSYSSFISSSLL